MSPSSNRLDLLRQDIDAIDTALHDLIVRRATIVEQIGKIKNGAGPTMRPGREADILRRLVARHQGAFPPQALVCLWRELMSAFTRLQEPFSVAVHSAPGHERLTALARDQFGSLAPLLPAAKASAGVRAVAERTATVAVLSLPHEGEAEAWWPALMGSDEKTPRVIARLPFLFDGKGEQALVIGQLPRDLTADEVSLLAIELLDRPSRARLASAIAEAGFAAVVPLASIDLDANRSVHLAEVADPLASNDARVAKLRDLLGETFVRAQIIGGYARQLTLPGAHS